jgi:hypothetical protein
MYQQIYCIFARYILGVEWVKKYWPIEGSYWHKTHMNARDKYEIEALISRSQHRIRAYLSSLLNLAIAGLLYMLMEKQEMLVYGLPIVFITSYGILFHMYNLFLANRTMIFIKLREKPHYIIPLLHFNIREIVQNSAENSIKQYELYWNGEPNLAIASACETTEILMRYADHLSKEYSLDNPTKHSTALFHHMAMHYEHHMLREFLQNCYKLDQTVPRKNTVILPKKESVSTYTSAECQIEESSSSQMKDSKTDRQAEWPAQVQKTEVDYSELPMKD